MKSKEKTKPEVHSHQTTNGKAIALIDRLRKIVLKPKTQQK